MKIPIDQLREIWYVFAEIVWSVSPSEISANRAKHKGSRSGILAAINDTLVLLADGPRREAVKKELRRRGLPSLAQLSLARSQKYTQVLRRGKIRTEAEFYLLKDMVDESLLSEDERTKVAMILEEYESGS